MRSSDQSLIARMGFRDPDKADSRHDMACRYFTLPETIERLAKVFGYPKTAATRLTSDRGRVVVVDQAHNIVPAEGLTEYAVRNGTFLIGFLDARITFDVHSDYTFPKSVNPCPGGVLWWAEHVKGDAGLLRRRRSDSAEDRAAEDRRIEALYEEHARWTKAPMEHSESESFSRTIGVEVKIGRCSMGEVIRQIESYRTAERAHYWAVATDFDITEEDVRALTDQKIKPIRLGKLFEEYIEKTGFAAAGVAEI